jgi:probable rRNA maturation factor
MILVAVHNAHRRYRLSRQATERLVRIVCTGEGIHDARISVVFIGSRACRVLNRTYLRHDYVTDVMSFPLGDSPGDVEGEVYVNLDRARQQAQVYRVSFAAERDRLVVHGTLHLLGYDDGTPRDARRMHAREDCYVAGSTRGMGVPLRK